MFTAAALAQTEATVPSIVTPEARQLHVELRLATAEEMHGYDDSPCTQSSASLECMPLTIILHNAADRPIRVFWESCGDHDIHLDLKKSNAPWTHLKSIDEWNCAASASGWVPVPVNGIYKETFRMNWFFKDIPALNDGDQVRAVWNLFACVDVADKTDCSQSRGGVFPNMEPIPVASNAIALDSTATAWGKGWEQSETSALIRSNLLQQEFWLTSERSVFHPGELILLTFHIRNLAANPVQLWCGENWQNVGRFETAIYDQFGNYLNNIRPSASLGSPPSEMVLQPGEESGDCMRILLNDKLDPGSALPKAAEYAVAVGIWRGVPQPSPDYGLHASLRFRLAER